ncbi:hypothetical protein RA224_09290 [Achromobacter aegrifaciens]|uniref:hypothetical protein n=1 Tax=Achromobacter aegrifaciens TaxID=1287736 RepID=UPI0027BA1930|nr:hypothetical protein [Achromobacter aegrifaciens]WLW63595.1 hypothetical protein RA224_09290 [Achromobacter aegrifaciens]
MNQQTDITAGLFAYLRGYGRNNLKGLENIAAYSGWALLASNDAHRRMERILESLPLHEVLAIANQEIDFNEIARQVLAEQSAE